MTAKFMAADKTLLKIVFLSEFYLNSELLSANRPAGEKRVIINN
jgi:hypothetical protein